MILEKITGSDAVFDTLPDRNEKITYDLLRLIKDGKPVILMSDMKTCITAQTNADLPVWIFLKSMPDDRLSAELCSIISYAVAANPALHVQSDERFIKAVLDPVGKHYRLHMKMNAYACRKPTAVRLSGNMIPASEKYRSDIKRLLCEMVHDSVGEDPDEAGANGFADYAISSGNVFLWEDGGKIASMVNVASRTSDTARLNTVVTARDMRGRGYVTMLMSELCGKLLSEGLTPMLYADDMNPSSNRAYKKAGFEFTGTVCEFAFEG